MLENVIIHNDTVATNFIVPQMGCEKIIRMEYDLEGNHTYIFDDGDRWPDDYALFMAYKDNETKLRLWEFERTQFQPYLQKFRIRDVRSMIERITYEWNTALIHDTGKFEIRYEDFDYQRAIEIEEMNFRTKCAFVNVEMDKRSKKYRMLNIAR